MSSYFPLGYFVFGLIGPILFETIFFFFAKDRHNKQKTNGRVLDENKLIFKNHSRTWLYIYANGLSALFTIAFIVYCIIGEGRILNGQITMLWSALIIVLLILIFSSRVPLVGVILYYSIGIGLLITFFIRRINYIALVNTCTVPYLCDSQILNFEVGLRYILSLSIVILVIGVAFGSWLVVYWYKLNRKKNNNSA
ncbi:MAG: hypothetical protein ACTSRE_15245 [Promethearchaeota archaeon]